MRPVYALVYCGPAWRMPRQPLLKLVVAKRKLTSRRCRARFRRAAASSLPCGANRLPTCRQLTPQPDAIPRPRAGRPRLRRAGSCRDGSARRRGSRSVVVGAGGGERHGPCRGPGAADGSPQRGIPQAVVGNDHCHRQRPALDAPLPKARRFGLFPFHAAWLEPARREGLRLATVGAELRKALATTAASFLPATPRIVTGLPHSAEPPWKKSASAVPAPTT